MEAIFPPAFEGKQSWEQRVQQYNREGRLLLDNRPKDLPPLYAPKMDHNTLKQLSKLNLPDAETMIKTLMTTDRSYAYWLAPGSKFDDCVELDLLTMDEALCEHPEVIWNRYLVSLTLEYYPEYQCYDLSTYFFKSRTAEGKISYFENDLRLYYAMARYVSGPQEEADEIANALPISTEVASVRTKYIAQKDTYLKQKVAVDRLFADVLKYLKNRDATPMPKWRDYLK